MTLFFWAIGIVIVIALVGGHRHFHRFRRPPRRRIAYAKICFWDNQKGKCMSKLLLRVDQNGASATLKFLDAKGNAAQPASPPVWSTTSDGVITLAVAADGMSAQIAPAGVGSTTINVIAEGDATPGVDIINLSGDVQVTVAEIATGEIDFGPVS